MSNVVVNIAGRPYTMQCPDGEEEHLRDLAKLLDTEVTRIRQSVGSIGDIRQLVMAGLMVADRLSEATRKIEMLESDVQNLRESRNMAQSQIRTMEENFTKALDIASEKMEELAK
jgi:cell division protein ZapA